MPPDNRTPASQGEGDLLKRCRGGEEGAWRELVARHTRRVFGVAYRFTGRVEEAEDLTQEVFIKVYRSLDRFHGPEGSFGAWLAAVARNQAIDHWRRRREEPAGSAADARRLDRIASVEDGPQQALERDERARRLHAGVAALPAELREPVALRDLEGLSYQEVAEVLGVALGTVKSRINRGRLELARRLHGEPRGGPERR